MDKQNSSKRLTNSQFNKTAFFIIAAITLFVVTTLQYNVILKPFGNNVSTLRDATAASEMERGFSNNSVDHHVKNCSDAAPSSDDDRAAREAAEERERDARAEADRVRRENEELRSEAAAAIAAASAAAASMSDNSHLYSRDELQGFFDETVQRGESYILCNSLFDLHLVII